MTEPETISEDKKDEESTTKDESAEQAASTNSAPQPDEGCSEPAVVAGDSPTPALPDSTENTPEMAGEDTTKGPGSEGTSEPKEAVFPPIDPAAGSAATVAEGEHAGEIVS